MFTSWQTILLCPFLQPEAIDLISINMGQFCIILDFKLIKSCSISIGIFAMNVFLIVYAIIIVPTFFPFSHLHPYLPSPLPVNPLIIVCVHGLFKNILWLILLPLSSSPSPSPLAAVNLFHVSMILFLFCSLVYCVHQSPHKSEIYKKFDCFHFLSCYCLHTRYQ